MYKIYIINNIFKLCTLRVDIYILYIYKYIYLTKEEIEHLIYLKGGRNLKEIKNIRVWYN